MTPPIRSTQNRPLWLWPVLGLFIYLLALLLVRLLSGGSSVAYRSFHKPILVSGSYWQNSYQSISSKVCNTLLHIEAEDYNRLSGIETEVCDDFGGGWNIAWIKHNDFSSYKIHIPQTGLYRFHFRIASAGKGGQIEVYFKNKNLMHIQVPVTEGWHNWETVSKNAVLEQGDHEVVLVYSGEKGYLFNLNWFEMELLSTTLPPAGHKLSPLSGMNLTRQTDHWLLHLQLGEGAFSELELKNLEGNSFLSKSIPPYEELLELKLPKKDFPPGLYLLQFYNELQHSQVKLLIF